MVLFANWKLEILLAGDLDLDEIASLRRFKLYKNRQNTLFKIRRWAFDVRCS